MTDEGKVLIEDDSGMQIEVIMDSRDVEITTQWTDLLRENGFLDDWVKDSKSQNRISFLMAIINV